MAGFTDATSNVASGEPFWQNPSEPLSSSTAQTDIRI
jgi:hypothetical protein